MIIKDSTSSRAFWWRPACWLRVDGADAGPFLQGQFTNDLRALERETSVYGLWLNVKGRVLADSFVLRAPGEHAFWIGSYFSPATTILERLESHIIADDVTLADATADWAAVSVLSNGCEVLPADLAGVGFCFRGRRLAGGNTEWVFPVAAEAAVRERLEGAAEVDAEEIARHRIGAGIPAVPVDIGPGDLPNEGGLEAEAISYSKGCYLGQEVMARLKSLGRVRRGLRRLRGTGDDLPELPAPVFAGERQVGEIRSVVREAAGGFIGLAMVSLLHAAAGAELALAAGAAPRLQLLDSP